VKKVVALLTGLMLLVMIPVTAGADFKKTKVAVLDFQLQGNGYETDDMGLIVAEWFITALVREGRFDVVERALLNKILAEQKMSLSGIVDQNSATQLGRILGVKVIISGSVMKLQNVVEINARIIDVETASIIAAESVKSTSTADLQSLIVQMSEKIIKYFPLEGYVVARTDGAVSIDLGRLAGVRAGMEFMVFKEGRVIKHPKTGEVLDVEKIKTGLLQITKVNKKIASADITEENQDDKIVIGHMVKSISGPLVENYEYQRKGMGITASPTRSSPPAAAPLSSGVYIAKLRSPGLRDKVWAAKKIVRNKVKDPAVFAVVEEVLLEMYDKKTRDRHHVDTTAWLCKALGASGMPEYKETLKKISNSKINKKIRKYAKIAHKGLK
jgi:TolB-like protein